MTDAECAYRFPGHFPELLSRAPDRARLFHGRAQFGFVPCDSHADEVVIVATRTPRGTAPRRFLDDELDGLQPPAAGLVLEVAHAHQALAVARDEPLGAGHAGTQGEPGFHEFPLRGTTRGAASGAPRQFV